MNPPLIAVIGSSNTDMVVRTKHLPVAGETTLGGDFFMNPGGKGANQAVAARRLGGNVNFIAKIGNDIFGKEALQLFKSEGLNTDHVVTDVMNPSGVALIAVDEHAENLIVVAPGANSNLSVIDLEAARAEITRSEIILLQLEIPLSTVMYAAEMAFTAGKKVILNPAPACELPDELLKRLYLITPNETEAGTLTGVTVNNTDTALEASKILTDKGVKAVIVTLGSQGAFYFDGLEGKLIPAQKVKPVDTTAAGDVFNGALAVALAEGMDMEDAILFANKAAAISVTRMGAQASAPYRGEID
ncbi:MAG: ribokinase [Bacteroidales bacterium]|nr:ribokinase [Bacteroidales bacterium]